MALTSPRSEINHIQYIRTVQYSHSVEHGRTQCRPVRPFHENLVTCLPEWQLGSGSSGFVKGQHCVIEGARTPGNPTNRPGLGRCLGRLFGDLRLHVGVRRTRWQVSQCCSCRSRGTPPGGVRLRPRRRHARRDLEGQGSGLPTKVDSTILPMRRLLGWRICCSITKISLASHTANPLLLLRRTRLHRNCTETPATRARFLSPTRCCHT